jgi:serine/threonine-protein kinase
VSSPAKRLQCPKCKREFPADAGGCPEHGSTLIDVEAFDDRVIASRYRLVKVVGKGGMGSVYDARHVQTQKRVAVKLLAPHLSRDMKLVARFRREAMAASRLSHPNCVQVLDFGEEDGTFYIIMEFIDGRGLAQELRKSGPMDAERVARIGVQLLSALDAAHDSSILHRDLKPQNVMLTDLPGRKDLVKVVDFGIAKFIENSPEDQVALTVPGTIFGTPEYMSPEQARGEQLDARSDLYSASTVLWHMLLGRSPFRGKTVRDTLSNVFHTDPARPSLERPLAKIPPMFEEALLVAMNKDRDQRFKSARAFLEAIRQYAPGADAYDSPPKLPAPGKDETGRPVTTVSAMAAAVPSTPPVSADEIVHQTRTEAVLPQAETEAMIPEVPDPRPLAAAPPSQSFDSPEVSHTDAEPTVAEAHLAKTEHAAPLTGAHPEDLAAIRPGLSTGGLIAILAVCALACLLLAGAGIWWFIQSDGEDTAPVVKQPAELVIDKRAAAAAVARAEHALHEHDYPAARVAYEEALKADPTDAQTHFRFAMAALQSKDLSTAEIHLDLAASIDPKFEQRVTMMKKMVKAKQGAQ